LRVRLALGWRRRLGDAEGGLAVLLGLDVGQELPVVGLAEQVAGVEVALAPGLFCALGELPVVEARAEAGGDRLVLLGAIIVAEAVVGQTQGLGQEPAFAVVLLEEGLDAGIAVAAGGFDLLLEVVEGDQG